MRIPTAKELAAFGVLPEQTSIVNKEVLTNASAGFTQAPPDSASYPGDNKEDADYQPEGGFRATDIASPALLIVTINKHFRAGDEELYEWQKEQLAEIAANNATATLHNP